MATSVPVDTKIFNNAKLVEPDRYAYQYVNNQRTENKTGVRYSLVLPGFKYEKVSVLVDNPALPLLFPEEVPFPDDAPEVAIDGLEATATSSRDEFGVRILATAKSVRLATASTAAGGRASTAPAAAGKDDK